MDELQKTRDNFLQWLIGFIEGEGCFTFLTNKNHITPSFQLSVNIRDKSIIKKIHSVLGIGRIHYNAKDRSVRIRITKAIEIKHLITILDRYTFQTKKKEDYVMWKKGVDLILSKRYKTPYGKKELKNLRQSLNHYRTIQAHQKLDGWIKSD